jgi:hypothetical protein
MVLLTVVVVWLLLLAFNVGRAWLTLHSATIAVRVTSSGTVKWGDKELSVEAMEPEFDRDIRQFKSYGWKPHLQIESYRNTPDDAVERLLTLGKKAGFDDVSRQQLNWSDSLR